MAAEFITNALVSPFVQTTIDNLASRFVDTFRGKKYNKEQLTNLKLKLLAVDVVTDDAEQKQFAYPRVREWLLSAKGFVFDAEDLLDEIDNALSKSQEEAQSPGATERVLNSLKSIFSFFKENEIESRMKQVIEGLEDLENRSHVLGLKKADDVGVRSGSRISSTSFPNERDIYGREDDKQFLFNWLTSDTEKNPSILSIVGMGGVGKTTLAQHVFNDPRMDEAKFDVKAWVCVSDEFDVFKVSKTILEHVTKRTHDDTRDLEMVHGRLEKELTGLKFFLVLDEVWNENKDKWEKVQSPLVFGAQGSRILVTTRSKEVTSTMRADEQHSLEQLQEDDCWKLFVKHAFRSDDSQSNQECREIGMKIVKKYKGLPLALKTMGSMLYNKSSLSEWQTVFQSEIWEFSKECCDIIPALALSYVHLPPHLKVCFAYCALFSKDYPFEKKEMIQWWMTEKFANNNSRNPEEVCQQYFNDLLSRSFFQPSDEYENNEEVFVMHDLLHDLAKYVSGGLYFRCQLDQTKKVQKVTHHFSIELDRSQYFDGFGTLCNTERLRTFVLNPNGLSNCYSMKMSIHELFSKFKFIRILSMSCYFDLLELPDSIGNLEYLRSLDLSHTSIKRLNEKICLLSHLQILILNDCWYLEELPSNLHLLTNLCRLELKSTKVRKMPPYLGKLKNLKVVMNYFNVGHGREFGVQQLRELNLEGSLSIRNLQNIWNSLDALEADLKNKTHLVELCLEWNRNGNSIDSKKEEDVIENLQPSKNLKMLSITEYGGKRFPNWLLENSLWNIVFLDLYECKSCERLPPLGLLPFLKRLAISEFNEIVRIDGDFHGNNSCSFKSLETLRFSNMSRWEEWECQALTGAFPCLRELSIRKCPKLKGELPEQVVTLETLVIEDCQELEASIIRALDLELSECGKLQLQWGTLKSLTMTSSLLKTVGSSDTIENFPGICCVSLRSFPLDLFPTLRTLHLSRFANLEMISQSLVHNHLEDLTLGYCLKLESLPGSMHILLPSLRSLFIHDCPRLESFPDGGFSSNLKDLRISNCSKLVGSLKGAFPDSPSLKSLWIEEVDAECFPDEGLLPHSLTSLTISRCPNLEKLDYKGLHQLSSLKELNLEYCPNLEGLPEEGLPKSISELIIHGCPLLKRRCQEERGEDWEKIAHIQNRYIY